MLSSFALWQRTQPCNLVGDLPSHIQSSHFCPTASTAAPRRREWWHVQNSRVIDIRKEWLTSINLASAWSTFPPMQQVGVQPNTFVWSYIKLKNAGAQTHTEQQQKHQFEHGLKTWRVTSLQIPSVEDSIILAMITNDCWEQLQSCSLWCIRLGLWWADSWQGHQGLNYQQLVHWYLNTILATVFESRFLECSRGHIWTIIQGCLRL